jgi:hypothetical protein
MERRTNRKPRELESLHCRVCGTNWVTGDIPDVSYADACWIAMRLITTMKQGYADAGQEDKDAIQRVGEMLWGHMLYGLSREGQGARRNGEGRP